MSSAGRALAAAALLLALPACSILEDDSQGGYRAAQSVSALEVPPDLASPDQGAQFLIPGDSGGKLARNMLLPALDSVRMVRDGDIAWLRVDAAPETLWPLLRRFLAQEGLPLERDEPLTGLLATQWMERRPEMPQEGLRRLLYGISTGLFSSPLRDSYVLRLERVQDSRPQATRIFIRHRGMEHVRDDEENLPRREQVSTVWVPRPRDSDLEARLIQRMLVFLGLDEQRASGLLSEAEVRRIIDVAYLDENTNGEPFLFVGQSELQVWGRLEEALENIGFSVTDRAEEALRVEMARLGGFVPEDEPEDKGFFASLFEGDDDRRDYHAFVRAQSGGSRIVLRMANGSALPRDEELAILTALQPQFR